MKALTEFCIKFSLDITDPVSIQHIMLFIAYNFEKGNSANTISTYIAGINYVHRLNGYYDITQNFVVKKLLEGYKRKRLSKDDRAPLTYSILRNISQDLSKHCFDNYETSLFRTMFALAYFGLFRISELIAGHLSQPLSGLKRSDITIKDNRYIYITLHHFKTNQLGKQVTIKIPKEGNSVCPVSSMLDYLIIRPNLDGPLFIHQNGTPVTRHQFSAILMKCTSSLNIKIRPHSFRIGRATDLAIQGISQEAIMRLGRWSSDCYKTYIRKPVQGNDLS